MDATYKNITPQHILPCEPLPGKLLQGNELIIDNFYEPSVDKNSKNQE